MDPTFDVAIIGAGIVGLATALALNERYPRKTIIVLEKEDGVAMHQTGHNSGVLHAGIYYRPGSHKARLCVEGVRRMTAFCRENDVPLESCGKLIVAVDEEELPRLQILYDRARANGVRGLEMMGPERAREIEPHARVVRAIYSPTTAIVDFRRVALAMARKLERGGIRLRLSSPVRSISRRNGTLLIEAGESVVSARNLISCAGLYADRIARLMGVETGTLLIPFRGEYWELPGDTQLVRGLIYPVPDPTYPFLGVHFTKRIDSSFEAGPNAVLALAREGYRRRTIKVRDVTEMLSYPGFWTMAARHWRMGLYEYYRSFSRTAFLRALQRLVPEIREADMKPGGSGVRAQSVTPDGSLADDFQIRETANAIHVLNAPSPAATASLAIGEYVAERARKALTIEH